MIDAHPALKAASPQAPVTDYYLGDDSFHNGAFMLAANFGFYSSFKPRAGDPAPPDNGPRFDYGTPDGYQFYLDAGPLWQAARRYGLDRNPDYTIDLEHTRYDDFWKARSIWRHFEKLPPAVMTVGGWFDAEDLTGPLRTYRQVTKVSPETRTLLVMGPWTHGSWSRGEGDRVGNLDFGQATSAYYRAQIEFPFFVAMLKEGKPAPTGARVFETGTNRWRTFDTWPPKEAAARTFYLRENGQLLEAAPTSGDAFDEYVSDPARPVPYVGHVQMGMQRDYMTEDQRFAARRTDVLVYETEPLADDLTVTGPIGVTLHVSTSGTDSDFVVKVIDVYPPTYPQPQREHPEDTPANYVRMGGYEQLVRGEPFRGKFRRSFEQPDPFVPNQPDVIRFELGDVAHTFRSGHRLMVQVQSSWFPLIDRNPQTFVENPVRQAGGLPQGHRAGLPVRDAILRDHPAGARGEAVGSGQRDGPKRLRLVRDDSPNRTRRRTMVTVYGANWCEDTRRSVRHLRRLGVPFGYENVDKDTEALARAKTLNHGERRTPTIDVNGEVLVVPANRAITAALLRHHLVTGEEVATGLRVQNVGDLERVLRIAGGSAAVILAMRMKNRIKWPLAAWGAWEVLTGSAGWCPVYSAAGVTSMAGPGDHPSEAERSSWLAPVETES